MDLSKEIEMTPEQEYELVYQGIVAVAAHCDGAQSLDYMGFDGQDTHYGRRVAAATFDAWTPDVRQECARIANKYQKQILRWTGIDVTTLQVVRDALGKDTNRAARDMARTYERRAQGASEMSKRRVQVENGKLTVSWASRGPGSKGDPDFFALVDLVKKLPGRFWNGHSNEVSVSAELEVFINEWDFTVSPEAEAILSQPVAPHFDVDVHPNGEQIVIDTQLTAYEPGLSMVKALPGRAFNPANRTNHAAINPAVIPFAQRLGLSISPEALQACQNAEAALRATETRKLAEGDIKTVMAHVSRAEGPQDLPPAFIEMLRPVLARYGAEGAIQ
jgi:hypothetical protein